VKRPLAFFAAAVILAATGASAIAGGNVNFVRGGRSMTDDALWSSLESQDLFGLTIDFGPEKWPIELETGLQVSSSTKTIFGTDVTGKVGEVFFGVNRTWTPGTGRMRPYLGGGVASVNASFGSRFKIDDNSGGVYVHGGIYWRMFHRFNIGFDVRAMGGTKLTISGRDFNANYRQAGLVLGWGWPRST
jgi:hypothetical protein